jgi:hypothetical protein
MTISPSLDDLRAKLDETAGVVLGSDLRPHFLRDGVLVVSPKTSLFDCAIAVATDDATVVAAWLADGTLRRPTTEERDAWSDDDARRWEAVIVQPFVLVQAPVARRQSRASASG